MNKLHGWLVRALEWIGGFVPSGLPRSGIAFDVFCTSIFRIYGFADLPSYRRAIAIMIQHEGPLRSRRSKFHFARAIRAAESKETAFYMLREINAKEDAAKKKMLEEMNKGEATPKPEATPEPIQDTRV